MQQKSQLSLILATAFLDILGLSLFLPLLPSVIESFWVHASWSWYTQAVYAVGMFIWGLFFGRLSDKYGRKKMLSYTSLLNLASYVLMLIATWTLTIHMGGTGASSEYSGIGFSHLAEAFHNLTPIFVLFLFARFIWWLWGAWFGVVTAYISDISSPTERVKNMGFMGASFGIAFLIGPALSWLLTTAGVSLHTILILASIVIFANVVLIWTTLTEPKKHVHSEEIHIADFRFSPTIIILLTLSFGSMLGFSAIQSMSAQFYADRFHFDAAQIGYTMAVVGLVSVLYQGWIVRYVRQHLDEITMLHIAYIILIIAFVGFSFNMSPVWLFFWVALFPLGMGSFRPSIGSLLAKNAGKEVGKVMGYDTSIQSIGNIIWPIMAGMLYVSPGSNLPFLVSVGIFMVLLCVSYMLKRAK